MKAKSFLWLALSAYRQGDHTSAGNLFAAACESEDVSNLESSLSNEIADELTGLASVAPSLSAIAKEISEGMTATAADVDDGKFTLEDFSTENPEEALEEEGSDLLDQLIEEGTVTPMIDPDVGGVTYSASTVANARHGDVSIVSAVRSPVRLKD